MRFDSVGTQQWQIPTDEQVLGVLAALPPSGDPALTRDAVRLHPGR